MARSSFVHFGATLALARPKRISGRFGRARGVLCATAMLSCGLLLTGRAPAYALPPPNAPGDAVLDLPAYLAELQRWSTLTAALQKDPSGASEIARSVPDNWKVEVRGERFEVPALWLRSTLVSLQANPQLAGGYAFAIRARLDRMRGDAMAFAEAVPPDTAAARQKLSGILARREFRGVGGPTAWDQLKAQISDWLKDHLSRLFSGVAAHPSLMRALLWAISIGLALSLLAWLARLLLLRSAEVGFRLAGPTGSREPDWREGRRRASLAARDGNFREAIRLAYGSALYRLQELGAWQVDRSRTPREYSRMLAAPEPARQLFSGATARFERAWYGSESVSAQDFEEVAAELEEVGCVLGLSPATASS